MPKYQIESSQGGIEDGEPFEAEDIVEAMRIVLEWNGIVVREVEGEAS